jgi:Tol biopolymer transport system component
MRIDGTGARRIVGTPATEESPAWSPDGRWLVFVRDIPARDGWPLGELFMVRANGREERRITFTRRFDEEAPNWSPNGRTVVFHGSRHGPGVDYYRIYTLSLANGRARRLTKSKGVAEMLPDFSPDGRYIAFERDLVINVVRADGTDRQVLYNGDPDWSDKAPAWSPDGSRIAFVSIAETAYGTTGVFVMNADGTGRTLVVDTSRFELSPDWVPE